MLTLVKLGGSLITDKRQRATFRPHVMQRLAQDIQAARQAANDLALIVGHGSGSFGHFEAHAYSTQAGVASPQQWHGFARVATAAAALNHHVAQVLQAADVPVMRFQPSASALAQDGVIAHMSLDGIRRALEHDIVPLVYGDVAFDVVRGGTIISTETVFAYLADHLPVERILLLGEVDGVYDAEGRVIPHITPYNLDAHRSALGGSAGVDVTGGMLSKVNDMLALAQTRPGLSVRIFNGTTPDLLRDTLIGSAEPGTLLSA